MVAALVWVRPALGAALVGILKMLSIRSEPAADVSIVGALVARRAALFRQGLDAPDGFFVSEADWKAPDRLEQLDRAVHELEARVGLRLGDPSRLLLLAVRPAAGRPVLCVGASPGLGALEPRRFHLELERRFVSSLAAHRTKAFIAEPWSQLLAESLREAGAVSASELEVRSLASLVAKGRAALAADIREEPLEQLAQVIDIVGAPALVSEVVFGNADSRSGCGHASSHDPDTGERRLSGAFFMESLGDEWGPGGRPSVPLTAPPELDVVRLEAIVRTVEARLGRPARVDFVLERGRLVVLDAAPLEMKGLALVRAVVELVRARVIPEASALEAVNAQVVESVVRTAVSPVNRTLLGKGLPASPGSASGALVMSAAEAEARGRRGEAVIYVTRETIAEDVPAIRASRAVVTAIGGLTSHAAVVARSLGRPAIVGAFELGIDPASKTLRGRGHVTREGEMISIEAATGEVLLGESVAAIERSTELEELLSFADAAAFGMGIRSLATSLEDVEHGHGLGARGVGWLHSSAFLARTPASDALKAHLLATDEPTKAAMLDRFRIEARERYAQALSLAGGPVAFGLSDAPVARLLAANEDHGGAAALLEVPVEVAIARAEKLTRSPSAGWCGVRFLLHEPGVFRAQVRAICEALSIRVAAGHSVRDEILVPFVSDPREVQRARAIIDEVSAEVLGGRGRPRVGALISVPRAAAMWSRVQAEVDLMVVDLAGLTAWSFGLEPGDALPPETVAADPFTTLDEGVASWLIGKALGPFALVGRQVTDPSVLIQLPGAEWIAAAPARMPAVRLAAARAAIRSRPEAST
ncbi:MAG: hypothetical protein HY791_28745 [Deltaproteobacteria bacterium]|nr:hypothetical protein [Deltaproteobacteria bacterium]